MEMTQSPFRHLRRSRSDFKMFARAYVLVWAIRLALWVLPFRTIYNWAIEFRKGRIGDRPMDSDSVYRVVWAISAAARRVPKASCLTQALATQIMLGRRGHRASLQIGIMKSQAGRFDAHAWVERNGDVLIGLNNAFSRLTRLPPLDGEKQWPGSGLGGQIGNNATRRNESENTRNECRSTVAAVAVHS